MKEEHFTNLFNFQSFSLELSHKEIVKMSGLVKFTTMMKHFFE